MSTASYIIIMLICLIGSAFFSATETAFTTASHTRLKALSEEGKTRAALALELSDKYDKLLSTLLIGNNIVNIALASIGTVVFVHIYGDPGATISTAVITVVVLIFGEISPKSLAKDYPERFAMFAAPSIKALMWLFTPINWVFSQWKKLLSKLLGSGDVNKMSQTELLMFVDEVQADGSIDSGEGELLRNAIEFGDLRAIDILTHRVDLEAVSLDTDTEEIARVFSASKFSRLLVYERNIDNIVGILHQKDFYTGTGVSDEPLGSIMTPPLVVPKSCRVSELLKLLQKNKSHIAVIADEYGGTLGIVTMEDILEELVGDIWDEHDEVVENFRELEPGRFMVDPNVDFDDFIQYFDIDFEGEAYSVSGWLSELLGKMPEPGDMLERDNMVFTVLKTEFHRVTELEVFVAEQQ